MRYLITGGAGFIGSYLVRQLLSAGHSVTVMDKFTYAGNRASIEGLCPIVEADICCADAARAVMESLRPNGIFHLAAESHVDRSIDGPAEFMRTNIMGTYVMLEAARAYWQEAGEEIFRFLHVSTDEVYGSLGCTGYFTENMPYFPRSPYSASKAASDHLVSSWHHTYGLPTVITNCSNNYGPRQFPEKLIPHIILCAMAGKPLPVYGDGLNVRDWLHVADHCRALALVMERGECGGTYNIGGSCERTNMDIVRAICASLDRLRPAKAPYENQIEHVRDRPGHDRRYAIDASKIRTTLGWHPKVAFDEGMESTVQWYLDNSKWVDNILDGSYRLGRLGEVQRCGAE